MQREHGGATDSELEQLWADADVDGDETLDESECAVLLAKLGLDLPFASIDKDGSGTVSYVEFSACGMCFA